MPTPDEEVVSLNGIDDHHGKYAGKTIEQAVTAFLTLYNIPETEVVFFVVTSPDGVQQKREKDYVLARRDKLEIITQKPKGCFC